MVGGVSTVVTIGFLFFVMLTPHKSNERETNIRGDDSERTALEARGSYKLYDYFLMGTWCFRPGGSLATANAFLTHVSSLVTRTQRATGSAPLAQQKKASLRHIG